ncbi:MAG: hypothetical protein WCP98_07070 [Actinomycetes bacterium]
MRQKVVGSVDGDAVWAAGSGREMPHVPCDDRVGVAGDGSGQNVSVSRVIRHLGGEARGSGDHRAGKCRPHVTKHPIDTCRLHAEDRPQDGAPNFFEDLSRPQGTKDVGLRDAQDCVPQTHWVQRAGVEQRCGPYSELQPKAL